MNKSKHIPNLLRKKGRKHQQTDKTSDTNNKESQCNNIAKSKDNLITNQPAVETKRTVGEPEAIYLLAYPLEVGPGHALRGSECKEQIITLHQINESGIVIKEEQNENESEDMTVASADLNVATSLKVEPSDEETDMETERSLLQEEIHIKDEIEIKDETEIEDETEIKDESMEQSTIEEEIQFLIKTTINHISARTFFYVGIPKTCYFLIRIIEKHTNIPEHHILLCLKKIRLGKRFFELADEFSLSVLDTSKIFFQNIPLIASVMRPFIRKVSNASIKRNLPATFKSKYEEVTCVINCLEMDIQKRFKLKSLSSTCSRCGKSNTVKYLISSTPDGLVTYISSGFTEQISDLGLLKRSNFLNTVESGTTLMVGKRFKHVEGFLQKAGVKLVRPNYIDNDAKMNEDIVFDQRDSIGMSTQVMRKLRQFHMLKQHAGISPKMLTVLDDILTIACGLINLQRS